jgi:hypothetical protein
MTEYGSTIDAGVVIGIGVVDNDDSAVVIVEEAEPLSSPMPMPE